jgi:tripartite-type tricarboxylate transporter receptor subunit TctC
MPAVDWSRRKFLTMSAGLGAGLALPSLGQAQTFPSRPLRFVVGFAPGGSTDTLARLFAPFMAEKLSQPILVENRSGANGNLATETVARAPADGHTLKFSNGSLIVSAPHAYPNMSVDPIADLVHVTMLAEGRHVMLTSPALAGKSLAEVIALSKRDPGKMIHASTGAGSTNSIAYELFALRTGAAMTTVHYRGTGPIINDLLANQVHLTIASEAAAEPYITSGRLGALFIMAKERVAHLPNVPSSLELGINDIHQITFWNGLHVARGTPEPIVRRIQELSADVLTIPALRERMDVLRLTPVGDSTESFTARVRSDYQLYGDLFKAANIRVEQ